MSETSARVLGILAGIFIILSTLFLWWGVYYPGGSYGISLINFFLFDISGAIPIAGLLYLFSLCC